jgi:hypothetical protein
LQEKRPRARHRFDFSGKSRSRETQTTTDQILNSLNRQAQPGENIGQDQGIIVEESVQTAESEQPAEHSGGRSISRWLFVGLILGVIIVLWAFGLFPRILYVDTVGSINNLVSMVPTVDIMIIVVIWMAALVIGLLGRRARHVSKASVIGY